MNSTDDHLPEIDQRLLDLLVDGELTESQQRDLLAALEDAPGGWRRCALAFLEARCWSEELRAIRQAPVPQPAVAPAARRGTLWRVPRRTLLAMAASFLAALCLGYVVRDAWLGEGPMGGSDMPVAKRDAARPTPPEKTATEDVDPGTIPEAGGAASPWRYVNVPVAGGSDGAEEWIQLPARERENIDEDWLRNLPTAVPAEMLQALEQTGYRVRQDRGLMPLEIEGGRRMVVPFDQLELNYVGHEGYQ